MEVAKGSLRGWLAGGATGGADRMRVQCVPFDKEVAPSREPRDDGASGFGMAKMPFKKLASVATDERAFTYGTQKVLSLVFLSFAVGLSLLSYTGTRFIFFTADYSISPDLISGVVALCLILPLYGRGILRWSSSIYGILILVLFLAVYASLAKLALSGHGDIQIYLVTAAIVLSWLGMRGVAAIGWVLAFAAAVLSALSTSAAMGLSGFFFIASAFLGLLMHSNLGPARVVEEIMAEYSGAVRPIAVTVASDLADAKKNAVSK